MSDFEKFKEELSSNSSSSYLVLIIIVLQQEKLLTKNTDISLKFEMKTMKEYRHLYLNL